MFPTLPFQCSFLRKTKQNRISFPCLSIFFIIMLFKKKKIKYVWQTSAVQTKLLSQVLSNSRRWCDWFHFTFHFFSSVTHYFTFINLTHQSCRLHQGRIGEGTLFFLLKLPVGWTASCGFWRLFSHPEIKLSAAWPVPYCWEERPNPNEVHVSSIKGAGCVSSSLT